jgi:aminoglycoside phosphotransferase (APT) family kinase protein
VATPVEAPAHSLEFAPSPQTVAALTRIGSGRQAELFLWPKGGVLKLFRSPDDLPSARREAEIMGMLAGANVPMAGMLGSVLVEQRPGILMERLAGPDHLSLVEHKPWAVWYVATALAKLHAGVHRAIAPDGLRPLRQTIGEEIALSDHVPMEIKALATSDLERLADGDVVCHWDFHPANVMEDPKGPSIIDWANARRGDRVADVARTLMILQEGALPPGASIFMRALTALGRRLLAWRYLNVYRSMLPATLRDLGAWRRVSLISRLSYGVPEERALLLKLIESC